MTVSPLLSFCQWASGPSPRQDTMPMPVMQPSRAASVIRHHLHRQAGRGGEFEHTAPDFGIGEFDHPKHDGGVPDYLAFVLALRLGDGKAGAFVSERCR